MNFYGGTFFSGGFFGSVGSTHGKGDERRKRRSIVKPTGLPPVGRQGRKSVEERVEDTREIEQEVSREVLQLPQAGSPPIAEMSLVQIEREIGTLLRKQLRSEDEEIILMLLLCAIAT